MKEEDLLQLIYDIQVVDGLDFIDWDKVWEMFDLSTVQ